MRIGLMESTSDETKKSARDLIASYSPAGAKAEPTEAAEAPITAEPPVKSEGSGAPPNPARHVPQSEYLHPSSTGTPNPTPYSRRFIAGTKQVIQSDRVIPSTPSIDNSNARFVHARFPDNKQPHNTKIAGKIRSGLSTRRIGTHLSTHRPSLPVGGAPRPQDTYRKRPVPPSLGWNKLDKAATKKPGSYGYDTKTAPTARVDAPSVPKKTQMDPTPIAMRYI
jgi:hypothetical protein